MADQDADRMNTAAADLWDNQFGGVVTTPVPAENMPAYAVAWVTAALQGALGDQVPLQIVTDEAETKILGVDVHGTPVSIVISATE